MASVTQADLTRFQQELNRGDRAAFYLDYYNVTGNAQILTLAQISSFSGVPGQVAAVANAIDALVASNYPAGGVEDFSLTIAQNVLNSVKANVQQGNDGNLSNTDILQIPQDTWDQLQLGQYFPGNVFAPYSIFSGDWSYFASHSSNFFTVGTGVSLASLGLVLNQDLYEGVGGFFKSLLTPNTPLPQGYTSMTSTKGDVHWLVGLDGKVVYGSVNVPGSDLLPSLSNSVTIQLTDNSGNRLGSMVLTADQPPTINFYNPTQGNAIIAQQFLNPDGSGSVSGNGQLINYAPNVNPDVAVDPLGNIRSTFTVPTASGGTTTSDFTLAPTGISGTVDGYDFSSALANTRTTIDAEGKAQFVGMTSGGSPQTFTVSNAGITGGNTDGLTLSNISVAADGSYTNTVTTPDGTATTSYDNFSRPISGRQDFNGGGYIAISYSTDSSNTWSQRQLIYNDDNALVGSVTVNKDGTTDYLQIDSTGGTFAYTNDAAGSTIPDSVSTDMSSSGYAEAITNALASQVIGQMLLKHDLPASIAASAFASAVIKSTFDKAVVTPEGFATNFSDTVFDIAGGLGGSILGTDIAKALGVPKQLGSLAGSVTGGLVTQAIVQDVSVQLNIVSATSVKPILTPDEFGNAFAGAGGTFLASTLANAITPTNLGGSITGAVAAAAALFAFTNPLSAALEVFAIAFGSDFIGTLVGDVIGDLFGEGYRGVPFVGAVVGYDTNGFKTVNVGEDNNGNINDAIAIGNALTGYLNPIMAAIGGTVTSSPEWYLGYGKMGDFSVPLGQWGPAPSQIFPTVGAEIENAAYNLLRDVQITGGNPMLTWELRTSSATDMAGLINDLGMAQYYGYFTQNPLVIAAAVASSDDPSQFQAFQNNLNAAKNQSLGRLSYDGTTLTINTIAAWIAGDLAVLSTMPGTNYTFAFADTAANTLAVISTLEQQAEGGHLSSIVFTDPAPPSFSLSAVNVGSNINAYEKLMSSFTLRVGDTAANIAANLDALQKFAAINSLASIVYTDGGTPTFNMSATTLTNDAGALSAIIGPVNYVITDTAANISQAMTALAAAQAAGHLISVTTTDGGTPVISMSVAQETNAALLAKFTQPYHIALADTAANVATNLSGLQTMAASGQLVSVRLTDAASASISVALAQTSSLGAILGMLAGQAVLNVTGVQPNVTTTLPGTGFTVQLAANDTVQGSGTNTYVSPAAGGSVAVTLTNSVAAVDSSGNVTYTAPLTGFGSSTLHVGVNGTSTFSVGSDMLTFQNDDLRSVSYASAQFVFGIADAAPGYSQNVTWNPSTGQANLVVTAPGGQPVTTSLGQVNPGSTFLVAGDPTITNTNSNGQLLLSTLVNPDGTQVDTTYNYSGGTNVNTSVALNATGQQTSVRYAHADGSASTSLTNPTNQNAIATLTVNTDGSGHLSTADNQTISFANGNQASVAMGTAGDAILTIKTLSGSGITESFDLSSGQIVSTINANSVGYALSSGNASIDASGNITFTDGSSSLSVPSSGANATFTVGADSFALPQSSLQSLSFANGAYLFGLASPAPGYALNLSFNPTNGQINVVMTPTSSSATTGTTTTPLGQFNPGNVLSISGSTISISSNGTVQSSTTINADGSQSGTFNNGAGALHTASDGTTAFIYGSDQLTFAPNTLLSSSSANNIFTFNIATLSSAYAQSITWNPSTGLANLVLNVSGQSPVTTALGQINPGNIFMVTSGLVSLSNASSQLIQSTSVNADGSQSNKIINSGGNAADTVTTLNKLGQQTAIHYDNRDGSQYTSFVNPANGAVIANFSLNANGSGYVATNNNQRVDFATGNTASVSIGAAGDTILTLLTQSGATETLDLSSGQIISTVNGAGVTYTLPNPATAVDASGNITITSGTNSTLIPANGSNAVFSVGQDSLLFPQGSLQSLSSTNGVYQFGIKSSVTGNSEVISWNPTTGTASLVLTPTAGGVAVSTVIGQINPGNILQLTGSTIGITNSSGASVAYTEVNPDGSQLNIVYNNTSSVNETVTNYNAAGQVTSLRYDNADGSQHTSYYTPGTQTVIANRQVNADGSGYIAVASGATVNVAAGNVFSLSYDTSGNPLVTVTNLANIQLTTTIDLQGSQLITSTKGLNLAYALPNPTISYDGSGNLTLVAAGSTLALPANGNAYSFTVGQDLIKVTPSAVTSITPNGSAYNFNMITQAGAGTSEYVTWNPQSGVASLNIVTNGQLATTNLGTLSSTQSLSITATDVNITQANGDGSKSITSFNTTGAGRWTDVINSYNAAGTLTSVRYDNNDGSFVVDYVNASGAQTAQVLYNADHILHVTTADASAINTTGMTTLDVVGSATVAAAQLNGFTNLTNSTGSAVTINAKGSGVYSLATQTISGQFNLVGDNSASETLTGRPSGGTTITAGTGQGTIINLNSTGGDVAHAVAGDTINVSGNGTNGTDDYLTLSSGTITLANGAHADLTGGSNTVTVGQNDILGLQGGNTNNVTIGSGSTIYVNSGNGDIITATSAAIHVAANLSIGIIGGGDSIYGAAGDAINVSGNGQNGTDDYVYVSNATVTLANNTHADIVGASNVINAGQNDTIGVEGGSGDTITPGGNGTLYVNSGNNDVVYASNETLIIAGYIPITINGGGNVITGSNNDSIGIGGNGQSGPDNYITLSSGTVIVANNTHTDISGSSDTITIGQSDTVGVGGGNSDQVRVDTGSTVYINSGYGHAVTSINGNDTVYIAGNGQSGTDDYVTMSNGRVNLAGNARTDVTGGGDTITTGASSTLGVQGGNANNITLGTGTTLYLNTGTQDSVSVSGNDTVIISGSSVETGASFTGSGTGNVLQASAADLSGLSSLSGIQTLKIAGNNVHLTASQLGEFSAVTATDGTDTIFASGSGTFALTSKTITGTINMIGSTGNDTLSAGATGQTLTGNGGTDTLVGYTGGSTNFLDTAAHLTGNAIQNFINSDQIDINNLGFGTASVHFTEDASGNFGTLNVSDGTHASAITMTGQFAAAGFYATGDGASGTKVGYLPPSDPNYASFKSAHSGYVFGS